MKRPVSFRWFVLALVSMPMAVRAQSAEAPRLLSAFIGYTELRIQSVVQCLEVIAATEEAMSADWDRLGAVVSAFQASDNGLAAWFALPDGTYYTAEKGKMDVTLADRSYFAGLMSGNKVVGELVVSKSTGKRSAVIAVPVVVEGKVVGAVGASLFVDALSAQLLAALSPSEGMSLYALAPDGMTALHTVEDRQFVDPRQLSSESLQSAIDFMLQTDDGEVHYAYGDQQKTALYRKSSLVTWHFAVAYATP